MPTRQGRQDCFPMKIREGKEVTCFLHDSQGKKARLCLHNKCGVRVRYDEAVLAAAQGEVHLALSLFQDASAIAAEQQDKQLETMAATAVGLLMCSTSHDPEEQQQGWHTLQRYSPDVQNCCRVTCKQTMLHWHRQSIVAELSSCKCAKEHL